MLQHQSKRWWLLGLIPLLALGVVLGGLGWPAVAQPPVTISVIDVAGDLSSVQVILDNYKKAFPNKVKEIRTQRAPTSSRAATTRSWSSSEIPQVRSVTSPA